MKAGSLGEPPGPDLVPKLWPACWGAHVRLLLWWMWPLQSQPAPGHQHGVALPTPTPHLGAADAQMPGAGPRGPFAPGTTRPQPQVHAREEPHIVSAHLSQARAAVSSAVRTTVPSLGESAWGRPGHVLPLLQSPQPVCPLASTPGWHTLACSRGAPCLQPCSGRETACPQPQAERGRALRRPGHATLRLSLSGCWLSLNRADSFSGRTGEGCRVTCVPQMAFVASVCPRVKCERCHPPAWLTGVRECADACQKGSPRTG